MPEPLIRSRPIPYTGATTPAGALVTHRAAVLGMPIEHSLSPVLHTAAYAELGLSGWEYGRYAVDEAGLPGFVAGLGPEWVGLSLTMPLKRVALEVADEVAPDTAAIGAANTLVRRGGEGRASIAGSVSDRGAEPGREPTIPRGAGWLATNTDVVGIEQSLRAVGVTAVGSAVVVGAGGTAQAALAALRRLGETAPTVLVRDPARAGALRDTAERLGVTPRIVGGFPSTPLPPADVVISAVPAGAADVLATVAWDPATVLLDVIYAPWPTAPAAAAAAAGCRVAGGLEVLLPGRRPGGADDGPPGPDGSDGGGLAAAAGDRRP